jgi:hypothetical protein
MWLIYPLFSLNIHKIGTPFHFPGIRGMKCGGQAPHFMPLIRSFGRVGGKIIQSSENLGFILAWSVQKFLFGQTHIPLAIPGRAEIFKAGYNSRQVKATSRLDMHPG